MAKILMIVVGVLLILGGGLILMVARSRDFVAQLTESIEGSDDVWHVSTDDETDVSLDEFPEIRHMLATGVAEEEAQGLAFRCGIVITCGIGLFMSAILYF